MKTKNLIVTAVALIMPLMVGAQALKGSYFIDNSLNRNKMNPAFAPRSNYFQMPFIGNFSAGMTSNLDIPTFIYEDNGAPVTFLSGQISPKKFDRRLPERPHFDAETSENIINFGFFTPQHSFWTFDLGIKAGIDGDLPAGFFTSLKDGAGTSGKTYEIGNVNAYATASIQAALGYSRDIIDGLRVGAKIRAIAPVTYMALNIENIRLTTGKDKWTMESEGHLRTAMQGLEVTPVEGEMIPDVEMDIDRMLGNSALAGFGYSVDLGAEYVLNLPGEFFDGLSFSAAVTDLGMVHYKKDAVCSFGIKGNMEWAGIQNAEGHSGYLSEAIDEFLGNAEGNTRYDEEKASGFTRSTMPNLYLGVEMPFLKNMMSIGLLYSGRFSHSFYRNELTAAFNFTPAEWFALGVNYSFLNTARTLGGIIEFTPKKGVNFFLGFDYLPLAFKSLDSELVPEFFKEMGFSDLVVPNAWRMNCHFGLSFALGSKYGR